jgi:TP901 family phage tail tape measure protein
MAEAIITIGGETSQLERDIQKAFSKDFKLTGIDAKSFSPALGKIKGQLGEFEKSLEASNARVVAFGASAGSIYLLTDAFKQMVKSTIDVEKTLADINTVVNASEKDIKSFGNAVFDVANKTSQSFETAAEAALEFSRQGLGLEQTAKRTSDALTLARLSGLSAAASVEALTAAVNSFSDSGLTTTQIVNKLAAVDAKYAVSSADLAEAIKRVGSSASEAGVNIDQLVALVTSAQQTTARGGAVIGNSFKTIFTRLQRPKVLDDLKEIGIQTTSVSGETLPLIQIITQLARTFDTLGSAQRSQVAELVGGVYQINILKAVLGDLSKEYSTYSGALKASSGATNEAEARIGKLGETLDSQINKVRNNLKRAGSIVGEMTIAPALEKVLSNVNSVLETFALGKEPETLGEKAATGFLKGLGSFISGPGLMLAAVGAFQIFKRLAVFVGDAGKTVLGLGQAAQQQVQIQAQILQVLQKNPQIYSQIESGAISVQSAAQGYLNIVNATNAALERQKAIAAQMAGSVMGGGGGMPIPVPSGGGRKKGRGRAAGYMPSISDQKKMEEMEARNLGAPSGVRAHFGKGTIGGKKFLMNSHEIEIPNYGTNGDSAVIPKYSRGFISRFAAGDGSVSLSQYMMAKYGMMKPLESLGGAALNAAYGKGVSLQEIRGISSKWADWNPGGASNAREAARGAKRQESQKNYYKTYGYRKIKLPWNKTLADFGNDPNAFGDAYEDFVASKFGAKRGERFSRANDLGASGFDPVSKYNTTDIDFVVPKNAGDLSKGGTLIEARGGSSKNYNPSDISKKFDKFFVRNPFLRGQKLDPKNWKRVLVAANAAGYIPRFAKGKGKRARRAFNDTVNPDYYEQIMAEFEANRPTVTADMLEAAPTITRPVSGKKSYSAPQGGRSMPSSLAPKSTAFKASSSSFSQKFYNPATPVSQSLSPIQTGYGSAFFTGPQSSSGDPAVLKALNRRERKLQKDLNKRPYVPPTSLKTASVSGENIPSGPSAGNIGKKTGKGGKGLGGMTGTPQVGGGGIPGGSLFRMMAISGLAHQALSQTEAFGGIGSDKAQIAENILGAFDKFATIKGLQEEYFPNATKGGGGFGKMMKSMGGKFGKTSIGKGAMNIGKGAMNMASKFGSKIGFQAAGGLGGIAARLAGPIGLAYTAGQIGQEGIDYFGGGKLLGGSFGTKQINKEQEDALKEFEKYKTETGKSISSYTSAASSQYGLGNEDLGALRKGAIGNIANDLGGMEGVSRLLKESGGVGGGKGSADAFTKNVISSLQSLGKEVGDLADPKNFGKAKDLAAGLISEVNKFEALKSTTKTFNEVSTAMTTLTSKANMVITALRNLEKVEAARGEALKKNFVGGTEGYLDPSKPAEANIAIDRALRTLNDPRLARNQIERGRAANEFLTRTTELGIDIDPKVREQMSQIMAEGMKQFQGQNLRFLGNVGASYGNDFGLRAGMIRSDAAMNAVSKKAGLTVQQYQLSNSQQAVEAGYLNPLQGRAMSLYGNRSAFQPFLETEKRIQQRKDDFDRLTQGRINNRVPEDVYNNVAQKMINASKLQENSTDLASQKEALRKMEEAFSGLDERLMSIARFGEQFTQNPANVNVNGGVKVELSTEAKKYLNIVDSMVKFAQENGKTPPKKTN